MEVFNIMPKNKQLTLSILKKLDSQLNKQKIITLDNGYELSLDLHFRNSLIEEILIKLLEMNKIISESKDESLINFNLENYLYLLLILNFTSLKNMQLDSIVKELEVMKILTDQDSNTGKTLFKEIIGRIEQEVPEELKKFNTKIFEIMQEKLTSLQQQQEFYDVLNKEILGQSDKVEKDEEVDNIEQLGQQEGDEFGLVGTTVIGDTKEVTE
jgi:hypothetical protein